MYNELIDHIAHYIEQGDPFAVAQVIWRETPSSGKPGDKAIILQDGSLIGWIGGGCVKGIAIKESLEAIKLNRSRLVRVDPDAEDGEDDVHKTYKMTCHSGGSMELFIEPVMPNPHIIIVGKSNIARGLAKMSLAANFRVSVMAKEADDGMFPGVKSIFTAVNFSTQKIDSSTFIVVATQGDRDEESVKLALETECSYVGFISSKRKSDKIKEYLLSAGIPQERLDTLKTPVGLNINAKLPEEIAVSILAQIIEDFRSSIPQATESNPAENGTNNDTYINPVCNIPVSKKEAKHIIEYNEHTLYFCCDGCKVAFDEEPNKYIEILESR